MKRILSILLSVCLLVSILPANVVHVPAAEITTASEIPTDAVISAGTAYAQPGTRVEIDIEIKNNPGILGMTLKLEFDESKVSLVHVENGVALAHMTFTTPLDLRSGCQLPWDAENVTPEDIEDGVIATLTFEVLETAKENEQIDIILSYDSGAIIDGEMNPLFISMEPGLIQVVDYTPGDVNEDGLINSTDVVYLRRFVAGGYGVSINESAADVNDDGLINTTDAVYIRRYVAGGYGITLKPSTPRCNHVMEHYPYTAPKCTEDGNISYYHCSVCDKYYSDNNGITEITLSSTILPATGHTAVTDPYVPPTYTSVGWTEGSHCSTCGVVLVAQEEIPMLEPNSYSISYYFTESDPYLQGLVSSGALVNPNPTTYTDQDKITLINLSVPGYRFEGWFDGQGANATQIKVISDQTGNLQLYAHWTKVTYTITFDSPDVPVDSITYTVDTGATLVNPSHFGYTFVGWSMDGKIMSSIPVGTIGNITLHANWTSDRNKAVAVSEYDNPIVIEDMVNGQYLFVFEIGTIQNVPLAEIKNLGNTEGISITESYSYTQAVNESFAQTIAQTVTNATTTTSSWTLSEDWNDTSSATTEYGEEVGRSEETTDSQGNVVEGKYYISNVEGGATSNTTTAGGSNGTSSKVTQGQSAGINGSYTTEHSDSTSTELGVDVSVSAGYQAGVAAARANYGIEVSGHYDKTTSETDTQSATVASDRSASFTKEGSTTNESHWDTSNTNSSSWNSTESYESATSASITSEVSNAISESIYNKYGYSSMIERGGETSKTASTGESTENTKEYSSTVEYSFGEEKTYTETVTRQSSATGYYRLVSAGTVHVFAVVGYNLATNSYFVYTYNVLDTERHVYLDYSKDNANFNDCENAILPFEVPYSIHEFMSGVISRSDGLRINETTGIIEAYTGTAEYVVIPEYVSVSDGVAEPYAVRVTGISAAAFAGNTTVKGVYLPKYVSEIPDYAFAGCASLEVVMGYGVSKIGAHAFDGCVNLNPFTIDKYITALGEDAFVGVPEIKVNAANEAVAGAVIKSGATRITLDISNLNAYDNRVITVPNTAKYFAVVGNSYNGNVPTGLTYKNLRIDSKAEETFISNIIFEDNRNTPLTVGSKKVTLSKVEVENAPGFALIMTADNAVLDLYGIISLVSASGNAVISKNVTLAQTNANVSGVLQLTGNYYVCGEVANTGLLTFVSGELVHISDDEYEAMLTSSVIKFNPNGGTVDVVEKLVYYGQPYGELPTPSRPGYAFDGWFTAKEGGTKITAETIVSVLANQTLYAHWTARAFNVSWNTGAGYTINVSRTASPYADASIGALSNGDVVYYGDVLSVTYSANTGYSISNQGSASITVAGHVTSAEIYCTATVKQYTASWSGGTGYTITVNRTSSPLMGASIGTLSSGATVYYGDVLSISYTKADYYTITAHGAETITVSGNITSSQIYATAQLNEVLGWVRASELPAGAAVVEQKWTYTETTNTESRETSLAGYTQIGSYWVESGRGSQNYATIPSGFDESHWIATSFARSALTGNETATTKREVSNSWAGYVYWHWMYNVSYSSRTDRTISHRYGSWDKYGNYDKSAYMYHYFFAITSTVDCPYLDNNYCCSQNLPSYNCVNILPSDKTNIGTPRCFRFEYYTSNYVDYYKMFQYQKVENKESSTEVVAGGNISNVQEWVKYREK